MNVPATARLPRSVVPKRTPSSSAKPITSTACGRRRPPRVQRLDAFERAHDAQHAVVLARIEHRVEVRAEHQAGQAGPVALVAADDVADRIETRGHARVAHPAEHEPARGDLLAGEEHARQAVGLARVPGERLAPVPDTLRRQPALSSGFGHKEAMSLVSCVGFRARLLNAKPA